MFYTTSEFYKGMKILFKEKPYEIVDFHYHKPGKGASIIRTKMKSLIDNFIISQTFRSGEKFKQADLESKNVLFLYCDNKLCVFTNPETFEQLKISNKNICDKIKFLKKNLTVTLLIFNKKIINLMLPNYVFLKVMKCNPGGKGHTVNNITKKAILETGLSCNVPSFININDIIKINTQTHLYVGKSKKK
jgi:elongation factor P